MKSVSYDIMMVNDDWVSAAMSDDTLVADILLRFKKPLPPPALSFSWAVKLPRSRSRSTVSRCDAAVSTRRSPTTPLSWSGGASPSGTTEDSSRHHHAAKSKAAVTSEYTGNSASTKRCKKKKTFAELKEEESSLLKERIYLKKEIANINANFEAQRVKNESLKRIKLDMGSESHKKPSSTSVEPLCSLAPEHVTHANQDDTNSQGSESRQNRIESSGESFFMIPDLNMMPEDGSYTEALQGMS